MKKALLILLCFAMICGSSACNKVNDGNLYKNYDESIEKETETSNISTISSDEYNPSEREVLEELAATRCTLDGFKQKFSNYRFISDNNDYCVLKTDSFTNTYFGFKRISGENGFSKFVLESISAPANVLLPELLELSFEEIEDKGRMGEALAYLMKYIEKTGEKIVYSRGLPQYFISDIMDEDIACPIGVDDQKLLLFDDFKCWDEGTLMGTVSKETIKEMRKAN